MGCGDSDVPGHAPRYLDVRCFRESSAMNMSEVKSLENRIILLCKNYLERLVSPRTMSNIIADIHHCFSDVDENDIIGYLVYARDDDVVMRSINLELSTDQYPTINDSHLDQLMAKIYDAIDDVIEGAS